MRNKSWGLKTIASCLKVESPSLFVRVKRLYPRIFEPSLAVCCLDTRFALVTVNKLDAIYFSRFPL